VRQFVFDYKIELTAFQPLSIIVTHANGLEQSHQTRWSDVFRFLPETVEVYNPASNSWSPAANMPTARWGLAAVVVNGLIYAMGGSSPSALSIVEDYTHRTTLGAQRRPCSPQEPIWLRLTSTVSLMPSAVTTDPLDAVEQ
jgi:hypothetical protein